MEKEIISIIANLIGLIGYGIYIHGIYKGTVKPHSFSWLVWGIINFIVFAIQILEGGGPGAWVTGVSGLCCIIITVAAYIVRDTNSITRSDWIALILSLSAIPLWIITDNPVWSIILLTIIDTFGFYPSVRKGYTKPHDEMIFKFMINTLKHFLSIAALSTISFSTAFFPWYLVVTNLGFAIMLIIRRQYVPNEKAA